MAAINASCATSSHPPAAENGGVNRSGRGPRNFQE
jgi:hypothetical protein